MKIKNRTALTEAVIKKTLKQHNEMLKRYRVKRIGLFGSFVRKAQKKRGDVDFLVEFEEPTFDNFMGLAFSLEKVLGKKVDLITNGSLSPYVRPYVEKEVRWCEV